MNPRPYLTTLTPLRGIAALIVVIFHSNLDLIPSMPIGKPHFITMGWLWVDFFFVLSGFILFYVYANTFKDSLTAASYWKYIKARFARVYPLHFVTMIWCLICALIIIRNAEGIHPFYWGIFNPMTAIPSLFLAQSIGFTDGAPLNTPSWSLSTEWWMYMIFPLLVPFFYRLRMFGKIVTLVCLTGLFLFVKYYLGIVGLPFPGGSPSLDILGDFSIFRCMAGFLLGMFMFTIYEKSIGFNFFRQSWVFAVFFLGTLVAMQLGTEDIIVIAFFPLIILSAAYNTTAIKKVLDFPFLQRLGDWSFSIYMVHVPIIYIFWTYQTFQNPTFWATFPPEGSGPPNYTMGWWVCAILVVSTLAVAALTYKYVEVPARNYLNKRFQPKELETVKVVN